MRKISGFCLLLLVLGTPLFAGYHYKAVTFEEGNEAASFTVQGWIDGGKAKILFEESGNPVMPPGSYLVTKDGGRTLHIVNPQEKTYSKWDLEVMLGALGSVMDSGLINMEVSDPKVEKLLEEDGGSIAGYPTTHYRYRTSYIMALKIMGIKRGDSYVVEQDVWLGALGDAGFGVWLVPRDTGFEAVDKLVKAERAKAQGFPLRSVTKTTMTGTKKKNRVSTTVSRTEVTALEKTSTPDSLYDIDPTFTEVPMAPLPGTMPAEEPEADEEPEEEEEKGGMFKKLKKRVGGG